MLPLIALALTFTLVLADGDGHGGRRRGSRQGRRRGQQGRRGGRQFGDLGPPPQVDIPEDILDVAPLPVQAPSGPANRFLPTGPKPGSALPPESPVRGRIPDRDGNYDFT